MNRIKFLLVLIFSLIVGYFGWWGYSYFFSDNCPEVILKGIESDNYYAGDVQCSVIGNDSYKVADISVWLDDKPLVQKYKVNAKKFEHPFVIPTQTLPNGSHCIKVEAVNGTYSCKKSEHTHTFVVDNEPLYIAFTKPDAEHKIFQGRTLHLQFQANKKIKEATVTIDTDEYTFFPESPNGKIYEVFIPIECEAKPNEYVFTIKTTDFTGNTATLNGKFQIVAFPFKKSTLHVDPAKVEEEKEIGVDSARLEEELKELVEKSPKKKLWEGAFYPPTEIMGISTEYGKIRTTQEKGRYMHKAVDIMNRPKSVIWATQSGVVVIKERYAYSGNTVVIDHGCGLFSLFFHLDEFANINVGDTIKRGNKIGTLGKTGYANGYHLHWEMRIGNIHVDPMQWINPQF